MQNALPPLTVNGLFIQDLMAADAPCFALSYVEEQGEKSGFIAMRPDTAIPRASTQQGFRFGHSVLSIGGSSVLHLVFEFYGHATYHGLVQPNNPIAQAVIRTMLETEDYFFFAINPEQTVTAFRSQFESEDLARLLSSQKEYGVEACSPEQYERAVDQFTKNPDPPGTMMEWVCRNNWDYLDITKHPLELTPRG